MTAMNVVRFRTKPGREADFLAAQRDIDADWPGFVGARLIRTGDRSFCLVDDGESMDLRAAARPAMIATLDGLRDMLEDLGGGLGVTDPVSGEVVFAAP